MPTYTFIVEGTGEKLDLSMPIEEYERRTVDDVFHLEDGRKARRLYVPQKRGRCSTWPMLSDGAAVHPSQAKGASEHARAHGVPTEFSRDGRPVFTGPDHRKNYCRLIGLRDRNGGYGDP
ncbi:MAG: hypothetical protein AAGB34_03300 [Planctomycetota bacterium]